jgi:uncharacterized protein (TIGR02687 family)
LWLSLCLEAEKRRRFLRFGRSDDWGSRDDEGLKATIIICRKNALTQGSLFESADELDLSQVVKRLDHLFAEDNHRIVFWHDEEREFEPYIGSVTLPGVTFIHLDQHPSLEVKILLEQGDTSGKYLIYMPFAEPPVEDDWLIDIRLYSGTFRADRASLFLAELGLSERQTLRAHMASRSKFLFSRDRVARLKKIIAATDDEDRIDAKMLAVLLRAEQPDVFVIVQALFQQLAEHGIDSTPAVWNEIVKFDLEAAFWQLVKQAFGYDEPNKKLRTLLIRLLVTDFAEHLDGPMPPSLNPHRLPEELAANVLVCLSQWRDSSAKSTSYDRLASDVAYVLSIGSKIREMSPDSLADVETFLAVEKHTASDLCDTLVNAATGINTAPLRSLIVKRKTSHWVSSNLQPNAHALRDVYNGVYDALLSACDFRDLWTEHAQLFELKEPTAIYSAYENVLYKFDFAYRRFWEAAARANSQGWDILKLLCQWIEVQYSNGYLLKLSLAWGNALDGGLLDDWQIRGIPNQYRFFANVVKPILDRGETQRALVVISDAFRYEAARELAGELNTTDRFDVAVSSQLSVLPSYTALGMAALLPHHSLSYTDKGDVLADGKSTSGIDNRAKILEAVNGHAISSAALISMKRDEGRAFIRDHRVVYIYHNTVDAVGDSAGTEDKTFQATRRAINELSGLVRRIINDLNVTNVIVTSDHGFVYEQTPPDGTDRTIMVEKPTGTVIAKKRYLLGTDLGDAANVYHGDTAATAQAVGEMEFWLPKATNRFHFSGGARFIHGGAMLQEVVVPVLHVRALKSEAAESARSSAVGIQALGSSFKITTNRHRFQIIQVESISRRIRPVTATIGIYDNDDAVSTIETVIFDSESDSTNDRIKSVNLALKSQSYDKKRPYYLIVRNSEDLIELYRVEVTIDLAFNNEF